MKSCLQDDSVLTGHVKVPGADSLRVEFDQQCSTERRHDPLFITDWSGRIVANRSGREWSDWAAELVIPGNELRWRFCSDSSVNGWGWKFTVYPIVLTTQKTLNTELENVSDRAVISRPSISLVVSLLNSSDQVLLTNACKATVLRLGAALASCAQLNCLSSSQRMWVLEKLRQLVTSTAGGQRLKVMAQSPTSPTEPLELPLPEEIHSGQAGTLALSLLLKHLPEMLLRQYEYEEPLVRAGKHLTHTQFFKVGAMNNRSFHP